MRVEGDVRYHQHLFRVNTRRATVLRECQLAATAMCLAASQLLESAGTSMRGVFQWNDRLVVALVLSLFKVKAR